MAITVTRPVATVEFCTDGEKFHEWTTAVAELTETSILSMADARLNGSKSKLEKNVAAIKKSMEESTLVFKLRGLQRHVWAEAVRKFETAATDEDGSGMDWEAFFEYIIPLSIESVTQGDKPVEFDPATEWNDLAAEMSDAQYTLFTEAASLLNRGEYRSPFSRAASTRM